MIRTAWIELRCALRSRWTHVLAAVFLAAFVLSLWSVYSQVKSMDDSIKEMVAAGVLTNGQGAIGKWVATDGDAADIRATVETASVARGVNHAVALLGSLGPLLAVVWGAAFVGSEYGFRTVRMKAAHIGWERSIAMKVVVIAGLSAIGGVVVAALGAIAQPVLHHAMVRAFPWTAAVEVPPTPAIVPEVAAVVFGCVVFALLGAMLALYAKSTAAAVVTGLVFMLFVQAPLRWWWLPENAYSDLLSRLIAYPAGGLVSGTPTVPSNPPTLPGYQLVVLGGWLVGLAALLITGARVQRVP